MIVKYLTAQQRLAFGDKKKKEAKTGFYRQAEVDDAWIGPFESLEEASTDGKQMLFWRGLRSLTKTSLPQ